jgi:ribosomal protein S18 acetylase RimI-like enzyme
LTVDDAEILSALSISIYKQYYTHLWHDGGVWYMEYAYNTAQLRKELSDPDNCHYLACSGQLPVGYSKMRLHEKWRGLENCSELERIYILREAAGRGLGKKLMDIAFDVARLHRKEGLFLKAMDSSTDAIAFYKKLGFEIFDTLTLSFEQMKIEYRGMVVLKKLL